VLTRLARSTVFVLALSSVLPAQVTPPSPSALKGFGLLGSGIGASRLSFVHAGGAVELATSSASYSTFGPGNFWFTLRYDPQSASYQQTFVSPSYAPHGIVRTLAADVTGDANEEILVALDDGTMIVADGVSKATLATFHTPTGVLTALATGDVDGDGKADLLALDGVTLYAYTAAGALLWSVNGPTGFDIIAAQMDGDPALEIATTNGDVVDAATHTVQWHWPAGFGIRLAAGDIDGDGKSELIAAQDWNFVWAFDVDTQLPKWSIPFGDIDAVALCDLDGNGTLELLVGEGQWGEVRIFDPVTQQQIDHIPNPDHGVSALTAGDIDGDGSNEILWCAGYSSSGPDHLRIADRLTHAIEYISPDLVGPVIGVQRGDLDGDGIDEIVACTTQSDSSYSSGRILVFDAATLRLRAISAPIVGNLSFSGARDIQLANVDADPQLEIVVGADRLFDGVIEIYDFSSSNQFSLIWTNATRPLGSPFQSVAVGDIDGDGNLEVVGGVDIASTSSQGAFVYVYDLNSHLEEWHSLHTGGYPIRRIELADTDQDGVTEIVALNSGSGDVYVFSGATKVLEAIVQGSFTSLGQINLGPTPATPRPIVLGDANGNVLAYRHNGTSYQLTAQAALANTSIARAEAYRRNIFVQAGGTIRQHTGFIPVPIWESLSYGSVAGNHVLYAPNGPFVIVAGTTMGVFGF
jgi:hypothetical protein